MRYTLLFAFLLFMMRGKVWSQDKETIKRTMQQQTNFTLENWQKVLAEAKKKDKCIFVDAYASWVAPADCGGQPRLRIKRSPHFLTVILSIAPSTWKRVKERLWEDKCGNIPNPAYSKFPGRGSA